MARSSDPLFSGLSFASSGFLRPHQNPEGDLGRNIRPRIDHRSQRATRSNLVRSARSLRHRSARRHVVDRCGGRQRSDTGPCPAGHRDDIDAHVDVVAMPDGARIAKWKAARMALVHPPAPRKDARRAHAARPS